MTKEIHNLLTLDLLQNLCQDIHYDCCFHYLNHCCFLCHCLHGLQNDNNKAEHCRLSKRFKKLRHKFSKYHIHIINTSWDDLYRNHQMSLLHSSTHQIHISCQHLLAKFHTFQQQEECHCKWQFHFCCVLQELGHKFSLCLWCPNHAMCWEPNK